MRLLVNGTCVSRGPLSWPYFLESRLKASMVNLSIAGVGNTYVFETTMRELCRHRYDLVIVTWTDSHHLAVRVDDIHKFSDSKNTSLYQSSVNDWPEKIVEPINDQDHVEKDWIINVGHLMGMQDSVAQFFQHHQNYVKFAQSLERDLTHVVALQSYLKTNDIPYVFVYTRNMKRYPRFDYLYDAIDWTKWYLETTIVEIGQIHDGRYHSDDGRGANTEGHGLYADLLAEFIETKVIEPRNKA